MKLQLTLCKDLPKTQSLNFTQNLNTTQRVVIKAGDTICVSTNPKKKHDSCLNLDLCPVFEGVIFIISSESRTNYTDVSQM